MFKEKNILCYFLIFILVLSIILITRRNNKKTNNILIISIIISLLVMYFNKELGLFTLVLSFVMYFVLQNNCETENFESESLEEIFGLSENENNKKRNINLAENITDNFLSKFNTQLIGLKELIKVNKKHIIIAHCDSYCKTYKCKTPEIIDDVTNTKIPEQIRENFPRGNVPDIKNVAFKQTKHNYVTCIKDNENVHSYGEPLDNPNYSNEERNKLGTNFYPLNK